MKKLFLFLISFLLITTLVYAERVGGHFRSDGTYIQPYYRSNRNSNVRDNYSYIGNSNPYTGDTGTSYYRKSRSSEYFGIPSSRKSSTSPLNR